MSALRRFMGSWYYKSCRYLASVFNFYLETCRSLCGCKAGRKLMVLWYYVYIYAYLHVSRL